MATDPTVLGIANMALSLVGVTVPISDFDDGTTEAKACKLWYDQCRRALLTEVPWPFATATATLNQISGIEPLRREYGYTLPDDLLVVQDIWSGAVMDSADSRVRFEFEQYNGVRILVTDEDDASIVYTADIEDPLQFTPLFVDALAAGLAARLALALEKGDPLQLRDRYVYERQHAAAQALNETQLEAEPDAGSIRARG